VIANIGENPVDLIASGLEVPPLELPDQDDADASAALVADIRACAVAIVEPKTVAATAERARAVPVDQKSRVDPEARQYLAPAMLCSLQRLAGHAAAAFSRAFA
jgi:hypothetical protein